MTDTPSPAIAESKKPTEFEKKANEYSNICAQLGEKEHLIRNAKSQCDAWHEQLGVLSKKLQVLRAAEIELVKKKEAEDAKNTPVPNTTTETAIPFPDQSPEVSAP